MWNLKKRLEACGRRSELESEWNLRVPFDTVEPEGALKEAPRKVFAVRSEKIQKESRKSSASAGVSFRCRQ